MTSDSSRHYELHLEGLNSQDGQIWVDALNTITTQFQALLRSVARHVSGRSPRGRLPHEVAKNSSFRVTGIAPGCTALTFERGPVDLFTSGIEDVSDDLDAAFHELLSSQPGGASAIPQPLRTSMARFLEAVSEHADQVTVYQGSATSIVLDASPRSVSMWCGLSSHAAAAKAVGRLEMADLRRDVYRIRDDFGNTVRLSTTGSSPDLRQLLGEEIVVVGSGTFVYGVLREVQVAEVYLASDVWNDIPEPDFAILSAKARDVGSLSHDSGVPNTLVDLSDEEASAFLDAIRS